MQTPPEPINAQLFSLPSQNENSINASSSEALRTPTPFYGQEAFKPAYILAKEEPQHRAICLLAAQGYTNVEIAAQTGYSPVTIAYVKKQPWAQEFIVKTMEEQGGQAVKNVLRGAALDAARLLVNIVNDPEVRVDVRAKEANNLLNRLYGSAPQVVMHGKVDPMEMSDEELLSIATGKVA
jgi:hypothetical protein